MSFKTDQQETLKSSSLMVRVELLDLKLSRTKIFPLTMDIDQEEVHHLKSARLLLDGGRDSRSKELISKIKEVLSVMSLEQETKTTVMFLCGLSIRELIKDGRLSISIKSRREVSVLVNSLDNTVSTLRDHSISSQD